MAKRKAKRGNGGGTATAEPEKKAGTNGSTTDYRESIAADLASERRHHRRCVNEWSAAKQSVKDWKTEADASQIRINNLSDDLAALEDGTYQPKLFTRNGEAAKASGNGKPTTPAASTGPQKVDTGAAQPIAVLAEFGLTVKQCEKLAASELELTTVGNLEAAMRADEWWHRKVKGVGTDTIDKVTDALLEFRKKHPVPSADDDDKPETPKDAESTPKGAGYPDRNAPGGEDCGNVNRYEFAHEPTKSSVVVAVGVLQGNSYRSSIQWVIGSDTGGRDTPRQDSQPYGSQNEAARAAVDELVDQWTRAGDARKKAAVHLKAWADGKFADAAE